MKRKIRNSWVMLAVMTGLTAGAEYPRRVSDWIFHVIHYRATSLRDNGILGMDNNPDGRGYFESNPVAVTPGAQYRFSVTCKTEDAPEQCAFARVFWYRGPDRGRASETRKCDDTPALGGTADWTALQPPAPLTAPADATVAVIRLESNAPKIAADPATQVALVGKQTYWRNWLRLLRGRGVRFDTCGEWLDPAEFGTYRLVILNNCGPGRKLTPEENETIGTFLAAGGHLILTLSTPYSLAGGKDLAALDWFGGGSEVRHCTYSHCGTEFRVVDKTDALTASFDLGDTVYTTQQKVAALHLHEESKGLVASSEPNYNTFVYTRRVGDGRVTFFGNSPPADDVAQPGFSRIVRNALDAAPLESDAERMGRRFTVLFRDITFAEMKP